VTTGETDEDEVVRTDEALALAESRQRLGDLWRHRHDRALPLLSVDRSPFV
jgi:hypothetical protein